MSGTHRFAALLFYAVVAAGCSGLISSGNGLITRLDDRGPVALSPDNPYLVGNLMLAREVDQSTVLRGFISHRGAPPALEVQRSILGSSRIILYYPAQREQYSLEQAGSEWIVDGPTEIDHDKLKDLVLLTHSNEGEPKLLTSSELHRTEGALRDNESAAAPPPPAPRLPPPLKAEPTPHQTPAAKEDEDTFQSPAPSLNRHAAAAKGDHDIESLVAAKGSHPAEITAKGDLVHYVTFPGETLSIIARWYTYDRSNADRIARINGIKNPDAVTIGDTVVIPGYLVRNKNRLTQEGLELLETVASGEKR